MDDWGDFEIQDASDNELWREMVRRHRFDELADLIAEAARTSPKAKEAYAVLRDGSGGILQTLEVRQQFTARRA